MQQQETKLLELFRAATETQKQMVLGTLQSCIDRNKAAADELDMFYIVGKTMR